MQRRTFVKSAAAFPFAWEALSSLATAQSVTKQAPSLVEAGQDRLHETHSLGFSTILFKVLPRETNDGLFLIEHKNLGKGGPALHLHYAQEEYFYVMEGEVLFQIGDERKLLHPGDSVLGPRNIPHTFCGSGPGPAHMLIAFTPAGKMEAYFRTAAAPNAPRMTAEISRQYGVEVLGPPLVVS